MAQHRDASARPERQLPWPRFLDDMPVNARPVAVAALWSVIWFSLLSPWLLQGLGTQFRGDPIDHGTAVVGTCSRDWYARPETWSCPADRTWTRYGPDQGTVLSRTDISSTTVPVERRALRTWRNQTSSEQLADKGSRVVTTDFPQDGFGNVVLLTAINLAVVIAIWVAAFWCGRRGWFGRD